MLSNFQHFGTDLSGVVGNCPSSEAPRPLMTRPTRPPQRVRLQRGSHQPLTAHRLAAPSKPIGDVEPSLQPSNKDPKTRTSKMGNTGAAQA